MCFEEKHVFLEPVAARVIAAAIEKKNIIFEVLSPGLRFKDLGIT